LTGPVDHARRNIAGENTQSSGSQVNRIDAGTAVYFEKALARAENALQLVPHGAAPGLADECAGEISFVGGGGGIPVGLSRGRTCLEFFHI
jgi:hypothetical protein